MLRVWGHSALKLITRMDDLIGWFLVRDLQAVLLFFRWFILSWIRSAPCFNSRWYIWFILLCVHSATGAPYPVLSCRLNFLYIWCLNSHLPFSLLCFDWCCCILLGHRFDWPTIFALFLLHNTLLIGRQMIAIMCNNACSTVLSLTFHFKWWSL